MMERPGNYVGTLHINYWLRKWIFDGEQTRESIKVKIINLKIRGVMSAKRKNYCNNISRMIGVVWTFKDIWKDLI
jgi:hypothetical protein